MIFSASILQYFYMCKSRGDTMAIDPKPRQSTTKIPDSPTSISASPAILTTDTTTIRDSSKATTTTSSSGHSSLFSLRESLSESPNIYTVAEISAATNAFLSKPISPSSSSPAWRCTLRGRDAVVHRRSFRHHSDAVRLHDRFASVSRGHHVSLVRLLGVASAAAGDNLYVVYEHVPGATLAECLRNPRNPEFTVLPTWLSRMRVAADLAQGLEYIHHYAAAAGPADRPPAPLVHNLLDSSSVIVTEGTFNAKICHFGASVLTGDIPEEDEYDSDPIESTDSSPKLRRSDSRAMKIQGTRGYMAPEVLKSGSAISQKSDVFALGVVLLELLSGEEPLMYRFETETKQYEMVSLIERARGIMELTVEIERQGNLRRWIDGRLRDSFPVEVAEGMARVAVECVRAEAERRPSMKRVAGKVSKLYLQSTAWAEQMGSPAEFSVSLAPR
ncbi:LysM domain receptor-like kinase 3 [Acorus calamus]|uniref:LysM domain receptor-like kinase 3 n=1 Tax=Acorus calamus TaxID=4465 RepID=A0AAV9C3W4_ACOCL|nr:LysM domain receptor-like kinase 3 [Acorus calamus]